MSAADWHSIRQGFQEAWSMVIDFPLPALLRSRRGHAADPAIVAPCLPALGALLGVVVLVISWLVGHVFNPIAGAVFFAMLMTFFLDFKDSGRGLGLLSSLFVLRSRGATLTEALPRLTTDWNVPLGVPAVTVFLALLEMAKLAFFFLLAWRGGMGWGIVLLTGSFTLQGVLAMMPQPGNRPPVLPVVPEKSRRIWIVAALIGIVLLLSYPFGVLAAGVMVYFGATGFVRYFERNFGGISADWITLCGVAAELLLLLLGILFALTVV